VKWYRKKLLAGMDSIDFDQEKPVMLFEEKVDQIKRKLSI
jgi:hypothetical protein